MIKNAILIFIIVIVLMAAVPAFAFGVLVRGPGCGKDSRKLAYTDLIIADHRDGIQKMIIGARQRDNSGSSAAREAYSNGIDAARKALYGSRFRQLTERYHNFDSNGKKMVPLDGIETSEVLCYIIPVNRSSEEVKVSLIDPAYGIEEIFTSSTKRFYRPANFLVPQSWHLASHLYYSPPLMAVPCLYHIDPIDQLLRHSTRTVKDWLSISELSEKHFFLMPHYEKNPESRIKIFECRDTTEFGRELLDGKSDTGEAALWQFDPAAFAPYCKPGNCFIAIKCTKATLPIVYIEFRSPDFVIPLKHLSNENIGNIVVRLISLSPFEVSNYNFTYDEKDIENVDIICDWKKIMLDLNRYDRHCRYNEFKYHAGLHFQTYNVMYLQQTTGDKIYPREFLFRGDRMIANAYNFFHGDTPEIVIYSSLIFNSYLLDCGEDLKLEPANSNYFRKVKFYVNFFGSETGIISLLVLISLFVSFISLAISGYATYGDWKRHIALSPFGIVSPALIFIALMYKYYYPKEKITSIMIVILCLLFIYALFFAEFDNDKFVLAAIALQVYTIFRPDFICCFVSVITIMHLVVFALIA